MKVSKFVYYYYRFLLKKYESWKFIIFLFFSLFVFGYLVKVETNNTSRYGLISKIPYEIVNIPTTIKTIFSENNRYPIIAKKLTEYENLNKINYEKLSSYDEGILVLSRFDGNIKKNVFDIYNIKNFKLLKKITFDKKSIFTDNLLEKNKDSFDFKRVRTFHPYITDDGSIVFHINNSQLFEIDFCGNLLNYTSSDLEFHHSIETSYDEKFFWVPIYYDQNNLPNNLKINLPNEMKDNKFKFNGIAKLDKNLNVIYLKSIYEILSENRIIGENFFLRSDFDHLNDIEIAKFDGDYFQKNDLFLSLRDTSQIIHFRPSTNEVVRVIMGPFSYQHDVDIISNTEISILNNNHIPRGIKYSELIIYNLKDSTFKKIHNDTLKDINFFTFTEGLSDHLGNYHFMLEETNQGRLLILNDKGEVDLQYVNLSDSNQKFLLTWSRIISDKNKVFKIKKKINEVKCLK